MTFFTINNQTIHVKEEGNPKKQLALLIHGWSSSSYAMSPLLPMLSRRYHCLAVDLPGYGDSAPSAQPESIEHYAELIAELIRQTNPSQGAVVVGHSMGGMIALTLATKYPDLVERLILLCPTVSGRLSLFMDLFISPAVMVERFVLPQISKLLQPYTNRVTDRLMRPASLSLRGGITQEQYERLRTDARRPDQSRVRAECFWAMRKGDLRGRLKAIDEANIPCLAIWGMEDNTVPLRDASILVDEISDVDLRILPRVSHWPQFEDPERTQRHIKAFLGTPLKLIQAVF